MRNPRRVPDTMNVFIDLSRSGVEGIALNHVVEDWMHEDGMGSVADGATIFVGQNGPCDSTRLRPHWKLTSSGSPIARFNGSLAAAAREMRPLLAVIGPVQLNSDVLGLMQRQLASDPLLGFAVPRVACSSGCCIRQLTQLTDEASDWLPRRFLADLPELELIAEISSPCVLIGSTVVANFGPLDERFTDLPAALVHLMASGRRCGFRTALCNRAIVSVVGLGCESSPAASPDVVSKKDSALLGELVPDLRRSWLEYPAASWERFERLCKESISSVSPERKPSLLIDLRNVQPVYNGTSRAVLGAVRGLQALQPHWDVALVAFESGARFHQVATPHVEWPVDTTFPDRPFTVAFRPGQPWHIKEMIQLHRASLFNVYLMLDVIASDITYVAVPHLYGHWEFAADHADAFVFESEFSRDRFQRRFPSARETPSLVSHFPFEPEEYVQTNPGQSHDDRSYVLVIGNDYDHKDVIRTVDVIRSAFPFQRIEVLGPVDRETTLVRARRSGTLPESVIHELYANAAYVVVPSFYEGFGFPIVTALAYGRTVLARRSTLVEELAARSMDRGGSVVLFQTREELVEQLGRLVHGAAVHGVPLGRSVDGAPRSWRHFAQDVMAFFVELASDPARSRWKERERRIRQLTAYHLD
jgi:glycosyltransferase involved in cell wall biosynthesis